MKDPLTDCYDYGGMSRNILSLGLIIFDPMKFVFDSPRTHWALVLCVLVFNVFEVILNNG